MKLFKLPSQGWAVEQPPDFREPARPAAYPRYQPGREWPRP